MKSAAESLYEHLVEKGIGYQFTLNSMFEATKDVEGMTLGAVSGFIHKAVKRGVCKITGKEGRSFSYEYVEHDPDWTFKSKSHGSRKGREVNRAPIAQAPEGEKLLSEMLFDMAIQVAELEKAHISNYSSEELLNEVKKRMK